MNLFLKILLFNVVLSFALGGWYAMRQSRRRLARLEFILDRLDFLDPSARPLSPVEEDERQGLLRELEELK